MTDAGESISETNVENDIDDSAEEDKEETKHEDGCSHYKCRCAYISPCCGKEYICRVCHNDKESHEIDRFKVSQIVCLMCRHIQPVKKDCEKCEVVFGNYFCGICRLFDDNDKKQFHCDKCGICRVGGRENYFHCDKCDYCLDKSLKDSHTCIEKASRNDCPVCLEDLHSSRQKLAVFPCGHICHWECRNGLLKSGNYTCPLCCQSICDMSALWKEIDNEIENVPMPTEYQDTKYWILCRDCHEVTETIFHILGLKCLKCGSYNTCRAANPNEGTSANIPPTTPFVNPLPSSTHINQLLINTPTTSLSSSDLFHDAQSTFQTETTYADNSSSVDNVTTSVAITNDELPVIIRSNLYSTSVIPSNTNTTLSGQYNGPTASRENNS